MKNNAQNLMTTFATLAATTLATSRENLKARQLAAKLSAPAPVRQVGTGAQEVARLLRSIRDEAVSSRAFRAAVARIREISATQATRAAQLAEVLS